MADEVDMPADRDEREPPHDWPPAANPTHRRPMVGASGAAIWWRPTCATATMAAETTMPTPSAWPRSGASDDAFSLGDDFSVDFFHHRQNHRVDQSPSAAAQAPRRTDRRRAGSCNGGLDDHAAVTQPCTPVTTPLRV